MTKLPEAGSRARSLLIGAGLAVGLLIVTQFLLPGPGNDGRGTPVSILFQGVVGGLVISLTAAGIVLVYRTTRVINFAQSAIGAVGATLTFEMVKYTSGVPFPVALALGLVLAAVTGVLFELVLVRRFFTSARLTITVLTIVGAQVLALVSGFVQNLPFFPEANERTDAQSFAGIRESLPFPGFRFSFGSLRIPFGFSEIFAIEASIIALLALAAFFRFTRAGVGVRALAENSERASLLGISVGLLSTIVWAVAGLLSGVSVTATGMLTTPGNASGIAANVLIISLAAAIVGRMQNLPITVVTAIGLNVLGVAVNRSFETSGPAVSSICYFVVIAVALLLQRRKGGRSEEGGGVGFRSAEEVRPIPKELRSIGTVKWSRRALVLIGLAAVMVYPFAVSTGATVLGGNIALSTIVGISLVVLTGWTGQVSLGQYGFTAVGAVVAGGLGARAGLPFLLAIPLAAVVAGAVAVLVGLPALRIKGLFLMVITFGFAVVVQTALFNESFFGWLLPEEVERPTLFFIDFEDEKAMYYLCLFVLVLTVVVTTNLRRSRLGRLLIATRENEPNVQSFGVSAVRMKLTAFAISGTMAGFAGAVLAYQQRDVSSDAFLSEASIAVFIAAVIGGVTSVGGVLVGNAYFNGVNYFLDSNVLFLFIGGFLPLIILFVAPGGLISLLAKLRDAFLRIVAQRRQIIVPSLFADIDPMALERRLIPLAEAQSGSGLAALPASTRYAMASELYQGPGDRIVDRLEGGRQSDEASAIGAAADNVTNEDLVAPSLGRGA